MSHFASSSRVPKDSYAPLLENSCTEPTISCPLGAKLASEFAAAGRGINFKGPESAAETRRAPHFMVSAPVCLLRPGEPGYCSDAVRAKFVRQAYFSALRFPLIVSSGMSNRNWGEYVGGRLTGRMRRPLSALAKRGGRPDDSANDYWHAWFRRDGELCSIASSCHLAEPSAVACATRRAPGTERVSANCLCSRSMR